MMRLLPWGSPAWTAAGWTMVHLVWVGALVGLTAALLRRALRRARPEVRHGTAAACLLVFTASPVALFAWLVPHESGADATFSGTTFGAAGGTLPVAPTWLDGQSRQPRMTLPTATAPPTSTARALARIEPLVGVLPGVWLSGTLATLLLLGSGLVGVERLRRSSRVLEAGPLAERCRSLAETLGVARGVVLAVCDRVATPMLVGVVRPLILLPPAALCGWDMDQVEMALLHELAHLRRRDNLVALLQRLAESWLFFHPVTWWLSSWVALEREICCDRLVVEHTGRPHAYARLLASLAGATPGTPRLALGMGERPLLTRIRRVLNMEDRSMRLTIREVAGLFAAAALAAGLSLTSRAAPPAAKPAPAPAELSRQTLARLAEQVAAQADTPGPSVQKTDVLAGVARSQIKLGDRPGALATLRRLEQAIDGPPPRPGAKLDENTYRQVATRTELVSLYHDAGDRDAARAALDRATRLVDGLYDGAAVRGALDRVSREVDEGLAKPNEDGALRRLSDEEAAFVCEVSLDLVLQCLAVGEQDQARARLRRLLAAIEPVAGPTRLLMKAELGCYLARSGDREAGLAWLREAGVAMRALPDDPARPLVLSRLVRAYQEAGDLDAALAIVGDLPPATSQRALGELIQGLATNDPIGTWFQPYGIRITIGEPNLRPKDPAAARAALPKIAAAARAAGDARVEARTLASVAVLQARAGDAAAALATARAIPVLKRSAYPGPPDGFYEAVKPVALALVAGVLDEAGDRAAADAALAEAAALARAIEPADQKLIALYVVGKSGRNDALRGVVAESLPLALAQPEPRRSRMLGMFAGLQVDAGDLVGAATTLDAIADDVGLEKAGAAGALAKAYDDRGDAASAAALRRRMIALLESRPPVKGPANGQVAVPAFGRDTFLDPDRTTPPLWLEPSRLALLQSLHAAVDGEAVVLRDAKALSPARRAEAQVWAVTARMQQGDPAGALELARTIEPSEARMRAFNLIAATIRSDGTRR